MVDDQHETLTLSGSAERLPDATVSGGRVRWFSIQADPANGNPVFGGGAGVTTADYGFRIPAPVSNEPAPPHVIAEYEDGSMKASNTFVIGTAGDKIHIHYKPVGTGQKTLLRPGG